MKTALLAAAVSLVASASYAGGYVAPVAPSQPVTASPVAAEVDWTGFYAGLQYGQGSLDAEGFGRSVDAGDFDGYGLHVGYLHDLGQIILGGELSYDNVEHDDIDGSGDLWRIRARAGYDFGKFQPYVTLGGARLSGDGASETGITYGIGGEFLATNNVSVGLEYSRTEFSDIDDTGIDVDADLVQVRATYRF